MDRAGDRGALLEPEGDAAVTVVPDFVAEVGEIGGEAAGEVLGVFVGVRDK